MAYSEAQKRATMAYLKSMKDVRLRITPEEYAEWTEAAIAAGFTQTEKDGTIKANMRQFIMAAINEKIKKA